uniref:SH3 domain-containing protein 19-like n=1 Tax=Gouania willdenowi TaxID=441366 RepID=A0A8C5GHX3_GOUWI
MEQKQPPEGKEEDELTFTNGDVIALLGLVDRDWGRGLIHGREGIFPLSFTEVVEPLPPSQGETTQLTSTGNTGESQKVCECILWFHWFQCLSVSNTALILKEWAVAVFDFNPQSVEDVGFQRGSLILLSNSNHFGFQSKTFPRWQGNQNAGF